LTTFDTFQRYADRSEAPKNAFYSKMRAGIYNVCEETLRTGGLHIIALNPGVGKTQFTNAYLGAMIEDDSAASALVVVEQIATVQERFETLHKLIPGEVACWTTKFKTVERDKLYQYPIACITHAAFMTADDRLDEMARYWKRGRRTLTVVDERLKAARTFCVSMRELGWAKDAAYKTDAEAFEAMKQLDLLVTARIDGHNRIDHLDDDAVREVLPRLAWFNTTKADRYSKSFEKAEYVGEIIGFARTMINRCAFLSCNGNEVQMIGYRNDLRITGPTLQLDATSLIDGVKQLGLTGRNYHTADGMGVPSVTYGNLRCIIRKPPLQKGQRIANIAKKDDAATRYRDWMVETVKNPEYLQPGQKALVVTKKAFTIEDGKYLPDWKRDSERPERGGVGWGPGRVREAATAVERRPGKMGGVGKGPRWFPLGFGRWAHGRGDVLRCEHDGQQRLERGRNRFHFRGGLSEAGTEHGRGASVAEPSHAAPGRRACGNADHRHAQRSGGHLQDWAACPLTRATYPSRLVPQVR
jgi:hypothetical protein